jgi:hypothetical protein
VIIAGKYSFNKGQEYITRHHPHLLQEVEQVISAIDATAHKTKASKEERRNFQLLYNPKSLNAAFKVGFHALGWHSRKVPCQYPTQYYTPGYRPRTLRDGSFREMDFLKAKLGIEVQFGKYSFMVYNVCAKMTIFRNLGHIDAGIEIVPIKQFAEEMSSGVSYFEQFIWDLEQRGVADIDIPVLILGIDVASIAPAPTLFDE